MTLVARPLHAVNLTEVEPPPPPIVSAYFDVIRVQHHQPPSKRELRWLREANELGGKVRQNDRDQSLIRIARPQPEALALLDPDLVVTSTEIATDYSCANELLRDLLELFIFQHRLKRWHRADQPTRYETSVNGRKEYLREWQAGCNWYTERRDRLHRVTTYAEACSRLGIDLPNVHNEHRLSGSATTHAYGCGTVHEVATFDFHSFALRTLRFATVDPDDLGRWLLRRGWRIRGGDDSRDHRLAARIVLSAADHMQELVDRFSGRRLDCLRPLNNSHLLPPRKALARVHARIGRGGK